MRKFFVLFTIISVVLTGCVGTKMKRGVQGNTFYSTYPEIAIKMADEFDYVNNEKNRDFTFHTNSMMTGSGVNVEQFVFGDMLARKGALVKIATLTDSRTYWRPNVNAGETDFLLSGAEEYYNKKYQYIVAVRSDENGDCLMFKRNARVIGGNGNILLQVFYLEFLKENSYSCEQWKNYEMLNEEQKNILETFLKNSAEKMEFIDLASLDLEEETK